MLCDCAVPLGMLLNLLRAGLGTTYKVECRYFLEATKPGLAL